MNAILDYACFRIKNKEKEKVEEDRSMICGVADYLFS